MRFPERGLHVSWSFWLLILLAAIVSPLTIVLSILLAAALHECGHLLALRAFHVPIEGLRLSAFGAVLHARGAQRLSYGRELVVTLAGCGMNLVCGVLTAWFSLHYVWVEGFVFAGAHILLCAFNLLPIPPLDGGRFVIEVFQKLSNKVVSMRAMNAMSMAGMALFVVFFLVMVNQDVQRIISGTFFGQ